MESQRQKRARLATKWACYIGLLILAATLQTMPGLLTVGGAKPLFILPLCMAVALFEEEHSGALFGALGGLLWDYTAGRTAGLLALSLLILCFAAALVEQLYLQNKLSNYVMLTTGAAFVALNGDFLFFYAMREYPGAGTHYVSTLLPTLVFTAVLCPAAFYAVRAVWRRWGQPAGI
ncbi:MAG: rod shape-determining protein MreD [Oscillospiraceae bacterium]|nr:rod shape-determining protein MreD [Oscillospiraceae bacterium]